jgi:anaerobic ribonucleoside-triphosphate reductase activating protein
MGGDQNLDELPLLALIVQKHNLKSALYTGVSDITNRQKIVHTMFDYVKIGPYIEQLGGLNCKTTNQRMYQQINKPSDIWEDITYKFWKEDKPSGKD